MSTDPPPINTKSSNHDHLSKNASSSSTDMTDPSDSYERRVAHAESIKVVNNRYSTPVTLKFAAVTKEGMVTITQKHVIIFTAIKLLDPTASIKSQKRVVYHHPKDFLCSQVYQDVFDVISNKNSHPKPHINVKHIIESTLTVNNLKYGQRNLMITLQQQQVFLQFNKFSNHREVCIGWFKYISTMLKTANLTSTEIASFTTTNYKPVTAKPLERSHKCIGEINDDANDEWKEIVFPAFDLNMRSISIGNGDKRISTIEFEVRYHSEKIVILKTILSRIYSNNSPLWWSYSFHSMWFDQIFLSRVLSSPDHNV